MDSSISSKYKYRDNILTKFRTLSEYIMIDMDKTTNPDVYAKLAAAVEDIKKCGLNLRLTYHGNPQMPKPKKVVYEYIYSVEETKKLSPKLQFLEATPIRFLGILIGIAGWGLGPIGGAITTSMATAHNTITLVNWANMHKAAALGKRSKLKIVVYESKGFEEVMVESVEVFILDN